MAAAQAKLRTKRARAAAIAVSVGVHGVVLILLALSAPALRLPTVRLTPDMTVFLEPMQPRLRLQEPSAATPRAAAASTQAAALTKATTTVASRQAVAPPPPQSLPPPSPVPATTSAIPPVPAAAASQAASTGAAAMAGDSADWRVRGDVHGLVHEAIGCGHVDYLKLTTAEQAACDRKYASLRGTELPHIDAIPSTKRAYYDSVAAAYAKVHSGGGSPGRTPVGPPLPGVLADKGGLYVPGVGCAIRFGIPRGWKSYHDRPPHSIKLGALPCFVTPPQGLGTEESAVEAPASLRERTDDAARLKQLEAPPKP